MLYQLTIPILTFLSVIGLGGAVVAARLARRQPIQARLREGLVGYADGSMAAPPSNPLVDLLQKLGRPFSPKTPKPSLQQDLARAGYHGTSAVPIYLGAKVLLFLIGLMGAALIVPMIDTSLPMRLFMLMAGAVLLSFIPNYIVSLRKRRRKREIQTHLPDAIDLLEICISAGMGMELAWNAVADEIRQVSPVLADEMALTTLETHLGQPNAAAMKHMAERTQVQDIASLTAALVQSERFGTSVSDALRTFATSLREERSQRAQEAAEKLVVKLIFPMVLFIFPAIVIVMAGPAFIQMAAALADQ